MTRGNFKCIFLKDSSSVDVVMPISTKFIIQVHMYVVFIVNILAKIDRVITAQFCVLRA